MAELAAAGVALFQLGTYGIRAAAIIYDLTYGSSKASQELQEFAKQTDSFSTEIKAYDLAIEDYLKKAGNSRVIDYMKRNNMRGALDARARSIKRGIKRLVKDIRREWPRESDGWFAQVYKKAYTTVWWSQKKPATQELRLHMESIKVSAMIMMLMVSLGTTTSDTAVVEGAGLAAKVHELMQLIEQCTKRWDKLIEDMRDLLDSRSAAGTFGLYVDPQASASFQQGDVILDLGRSMAATGTVPEMPSQPTSVTREALRYGQDTGSKRRRRVGRTPIISARSLSAISIQQAPGSPGREPPPVPRSVNDIEGQGARTASAEHPGIIISLSPAAAFEIEPGYLTRPGARAVLGETQQRPALAKVVPSLDRNVISISEAKKFGLEVKVATENVNFEFLGGEPRPSLGMVTVAWHHGIIPTPSSRPLILEFWVCENSEVKIVLGKPFLKARERSWSKRSRSYGSREEQVGALAMGEKDKGETEI